MDVFADADTRRHASQVFKLGYADGGFVPEELVAALDSLDLDDVTGFVYGSGFEAQPELLEHIEKRLPLLGNRPIVVRNLKRALQFFTLLDALHIAHPEVRFDALENAEGWLQKHAGGSGGTHVMQAQKQTALSSGYYFQREIPGIPASMLFLADGQGIKRIGFNQQWVAVSTSMPYRYGGIVGHAELSDDIKQQFMQAAQKLTSAVGLRGLNSLDAIIADGKIWVLEINPRLSSTFDLYQSGLCNLFDLHVQACGGKLLDCSAIPAVSKARHVVYAPHDLLMGDNVAWPEWMADIPVAHSVIAKDNPVCTVLAEATDASLARAMVLGRKAEIDDLIKTLKVI